MKNLSIILSTALIIGLTACGGGEKKPEDLNTKLRTEHDKLNKEHEAMKIEHATMVQQLRSFTAEYTKKNPKPDSSYIKMVQSHDSLLKVHDRVIENHDGLLLSFDTSTKRHESKEIKDAEVEEAFKRAQDEDKKMELQHEEMKKLHKMFAEKQQALIKK